MQQQCYYRDLSDAEWLIVKPYLPEQQRRGRPWRHSRRKILNAIFYSIRSRCAWHLLPRDLPPWKTIYHYWRPWRQDGTWERLHAALRERTRLHAGRNAQPTACIIDSQSVKTTSIGGIRGYDGAKKVSGRKRHVVVDTQGLVLQAKVQAANLQDHAALPVVLEDVAARFPHLRHTWVDQGYTGSGKPRIEEQLGWTVTVVRHPSKPRGEWRPHGDLNDLSTVWFEWVRLPAQRTGFRGILPRRWVVNGQLLGSVTTVG